MDKVRPPTPHTVTAWLWVTFLVHIVCMVEDGRDIYIWVGNMCTIVAMMV